MDILSLILQYLGLKRGRVMVAMFFVIIIWAAIMATLITMWLWWAS